MRDELLAARFIQTLEQMRALQMEPQLELARQLRATDVFWNQREPPDDALARVVRRRVPQQKDVRELAAFRRIQSVAT